MIFRICFLLCVPLPLLAAPRDSAAVNNTSRRAVVIGGLSALAGVSLVYLHQEWYKPYRTARFHEFNDNAEWLQVDKAGHFFTAYQGARLTSEALTWAGCGNRNSMIAGTAVSLGYLTAIELMDGYSTGWGFS